MGFFSSIKKFFSSDTSSTPKDDTQAQQTTATTQTHDVLPESSDDSATTNNNDEAIIAAETPQEIFTISSANDARSSETAMEQAASALSVEETTITEEEKAVTPAEIIAHEAIAQDTAPMIHETTSAAEENATLMDNSVPPLEDISTPEVENTSPTTESAAETPNTTDTAAIITAADTVAPAVQTEAPEEKGISSSSEAEDISLATESTVAETPDTTDTAAVITAADTIAPVVQAAASKEEKGFLSSFKKLFSSKPSPQQEQPVQADLPPVENTVTAASPEEAAMTLRLRDAEPRLSAWLNIVLEGISEADDQLWQRLRFLLRSLDAPSSEVDAFLADFKGWLNRMEYRWLEEFRSELQYRLALALDLEDEEDERSRLFIKLTQGLARTRESFARHMDAVFSAHSALDEAFWEEMEEIFIMADLGYEPALELVQRLKERARKAGVNDPQGVRELLRTEIEEIFRAPRRITAVNPPEVILMIGVNGVGKTTTIAKLAHRARMQGKKTLIAAADTFRAAAVEQLKVWADRVGADFHCKATGADPAAVAYEAMERAVNGGYDVLFVDTAGRLQTKVNLMEELTKIRQVLGKKHEGAPHRSILVIDATTGQNALSQTKLFKEAAGLDELILTKLDGTAKGGVAIAVAMQHNVPITYVGLGEKLEDLRPFDGAAFARALLGEAQ